MQKSHTESEKRKLVYLFIAVFALFNVPSDLSFDKSQVSNFLLDRIYLKGSLNKISWQMNIADK